MASHGGSPQGNELGEFLRARRGSLDPSRLGLVDDGRLRRVPGLRREELALLAHVSPDYVVRLEQGRTRRVSRAVLDALADALQLAPDERSYLFALAEVTESVHTGQPPRHQVGRQLQELLDAMREVPAMVLDYRHDVLAWNPAAAALLTDFGALPPDERNLIRLTFLHSPYRALYADWARAARECVSVLRMETGRHPDDPILAALVEELNAQDPDFKTWWKAHSVRGPRQLTKTYNHPIAGPLTLDVQQLTVAAQPDQFVVAYTAPPGTPSEQALRFLLQWSGHPGERLSPDTDAGTHRQPERRSPRTTQEP